LSGFRLNHVVQVPDVATLAELNARIDTADAADDAAGSTGAGLIASTLKTGRRSQGLILTCLTGITGALAGGWAAVRPLRV
jgi:hypothetical protein